MANRNLSPVILLGGLSINLNHLKRTTCFIGMINKLGPFQQVKTLIAKANTTPLRYYDRNLPVTVQADASLRGLGACLIQQHKGKDQPIAFASKSLTDAETRYANIERELLAIVFACQRFSTYLLGRSFVAESDHKPLEMIAMKNLANAPPCLQRMLLELQKYDVTIKYRPGKEMQLADALSRCPARASQQIKLDMRVDFIAFTKPWIEETEGQHTEKPHSSDGVSAHTTRLAASKKTRTTFSEEILGLQRRTINRLWNAPERTEVNHTRGTSRGVFKPSTRRPSLSK